MALPVIGFDVTALPETSTPIVFPRIAMSLVLLVNAMAASPATFPMALFLMTTPLEVSMLMALPVIPSKPFNPVPNRLPSILISLNGDFSILMAFLLKSLKSDLVMLILAIESEKIKPVLPA